MPEKEPTKDLFKPFNKIGVCFSGGGYRATFFALGVLSYLDQVNFKNKSILSTIKALSTVSGGTLTGIAYAKAIQEPDYNFNSFFKTFYYAFIPENDELLKTAISKLQNDKIWKLNPYKNRSLINAFALTYSQMPLFNGTFGCFKDNKIKQLEQVCFNATDFSFGLTYRFQNKGYFGNNPLYKNNQKEINALRNQVELGDVIASSSCFPVGFEPLIFPDDYFSNQKSEEYQNLKSLDCFANGVGIMDGGIADNQGIGSMMLINDRINKGLDLIIVCDVGSYKMKPWQQDQTEIKKSTSVNSLANKVLQYFTIKPLYWIVFILGILIITINNSQHVNLYVVGGILVGFGLLSVVLSHIASNKKNNVLKKLKTIFNKNVPEPLIEDILSFKKLDINLVKVLLVNRMTSATTMINDVFLKQMRRLSYDLFYSKSKLKNKRITATVYKLNGKKTPYNNGVSYNKTIKPKPSKQLETASLIASETPTTLWWDKTDVEKNRMENLIACGQFTICYELMDYIIKLKADPNLEELDFLEIDKLYTLLKQHWVAFNKQPLWLVDKIK